MKFTKMHGLGNDYIYVNALQERVDDPPALARAMSDRFRGVGSDGLILIRPSDRADARMEMYNADGSRAQMCGNGIRCVGKYVVEHGLAAGPEVKIDTDAGVKILQCRLRDGRVESVRVDMGEPSLDPRSLPCTIPASRVLNYAIEIAGHPYQITCVSMGNPHAVVFVEDPRAIDLARIGPLFESHAFFPQRTNTHFVRVDADDHVTMVTWERGSGATQACGTGACAVAVAAAATGRTRRTLTAALPGGDLLLEWAENNHVYKTGPAVEVFSGEWPE